MPTMVTRSIGVAAVVLMAPVAIVAGQATFTPSYNAPYRAFTRHEFGGTFSFPDGGRDFAIEGQYRFGQGRIDVGLRGGIIDNDAGGSDVILGVEGRGRVIDHTRGSFPLDGAIVIGLGTAEFDAWTVPSAGLSLGRRVDLEDFSFILYGQPTLFLFTNGDTDVEFGMGLGADFRVGRALDLRVSVGLFDGPEGLAVSLVWVR
jgi:hypothetical protein